MTIDHTGTVFRAMAVLNAIAEADRDVAIADLTRDLGLAPSTCHRLLDLLSEGGFVERDPRLRRYRIGPAFQRLASLVASRTDLSTLARPIMERLTARSGETSVLARYDAINRSVFFIGTADAAHPLRYRIKLYEPVPAAWGASGRAAAAWLEISDATALYESVQTAPESGRKWSSLDEFLAELAEIRARGYAISRGEKLAGAVGVSAPVLGSGESVVGSLSVTIPEQRFVESTLEQTASHVRAAAAELSRLQGFRPKESATS